MADTPSTKCKTTSVHSLRRRSLRHAERALEDEEREVQGLPVISRAKKPFTEKESAKLGDFLPKPFSRKREHAKPEAATATNRTPTTKKQLQSIPKTMAPSLATEAENDTEWHTTPVNPYDHVQLKFTDEQARLTLKYPLKYKKEHARLIKSGMLNQDNAVIPSGHTLSGPGDVSILARADVERHLAILKSNARVNDINDRRAMNNLAKAAEECYRALKPLLHTKSTFLRDEHVNYEKLIEMSADEIIGEVGQQTRDYYLALFECYKISKPELYVRLMKNILDVDIEIEDMDIAPGDATQVHDASIDFWIHTPAFRGGKGGRGESDQDEDEGESADEQLE